MICVVLDGRLKGREEFGDEVDKVASTVARFRSMWRFLWNGHHKLEE